MSTDPELVYAILKAILQAWFEYLQTPFDLPFLGRAPYFLYLDVLGWFCFIFLLFAKAISIMIRAFGKRNA